MCYVVHRIKWSEKKTNCNFFSNERYVAPATTPVLSLSLWRVKSRPKYNVYIVHTNHCYAYCGDLRSPIWQENKLYHRASIIERLSMSNSNSRAFPLCIRHSQFARAVGLSKDRREPVCVHIPAIATLLISLPLPRSFMDLVCLAGLCYSLY